VAAAARDKREQIKKTTTNRFFVLLFLVFFFFFTFYIIRTIYIIYTIVGIRVHVLTMHVWVCGDNHAKSTSIYGVIKPLICRRANTHTNTRSRVPICVCLETNIQVRIHMRGIYVVHTIILASVENDHVAIRPWPIVNGRITELNKSKNKFISGGCYLTTAILNELYLVWRDPKNNCPNNNLIVKNWKR
jgi:hypothetical protein